VGVLPLDRLPQRRLVYRAPRAGEAEPEALAVVEAEILAVVGRAIEGEAVLVERGDECVAVLRFVVDDDAVEIEQYGSRQARKV
jgi:hypothetical protein